MKTDYQKVNLFDASAVFVAAFGLLLVGLFVFLSFPESQQKNVISALAVLDIGDAMARQEETLLAVLETTDNVNNAFYVAFTDLATLPDTLTVWTDGARVAWEKFGEFSENVVGNSYRQAYVFQINSQRGEILGAFIDKTVTVINDVNTRKQSGSVAGTQTSTNLLINY
jgi:hypothetical protein